MYIVHKPYSINVSVLIYMKCLQSVQSSSYVVQQITENLRKKLHKGIIIYIATDTYEGVYVQMTLNSTLGKSHSLKLKIGQYLVFGSLHC